MSCSDVCPVKVDLAEQIYKWRQDLDGLGKANTGKKIGVRWNEVPDGASGIVQCCFCGRAPMINSSRLRNNNDFDDWKGRELPEFAKESFNEMWKKENKGSGGGI